MNSISQINVEQKLDEFLREFREGRREGSIVSTQTVESLSADDRETWTLIRKELEEIGITVAGFEANKVYIVNRLAEAVSSGAFTEETPIDGATTPQPGYWSGQIEPSPQPESSQSADESSSSTSLVTAADNMRDVAILEGDPERVMLQSKAKTPQSAYLQGQVESHQQPESSQPAGQIPSSTSTAIAVGSSSNVATLEGDSVRATSQLEGDTLPPTATREHPLKSSRVWRLRTLIAQLSSPRNSLVSAVQAGNYRKIVHILNDEAKSSLIDQEELNEALYQSCETPFRDATQVLLEHGAIANWNSPASGLAALHRAVCYRAVWLTRLLIDHGANVNIKSRQLSTHGYRPLHFAAKNGDSSMVKILLEAHADSEVLDKTGSSPLQMAVEKAQNEVVPVVRMLLEAGADVNRASIGERSLLHIAVCQDCPDLVQVMLEHGADLPTGNAALSMLISATYRGERVTKLLLAAGLDPNSPGSEGVSALMTAALDKRPRIVRLLLIYGAIHVVDVLAPTTDYYRRAEYLIEQEQRELRRLKQEWQRQPDDNSWIRAHFKGKEAWLIQTWKRCIPSAAVQLHEKNTSHGGVQLERYMLLL